MTSQEINGHIFRYVRTGTYTYSTVVPIGPERSRVCLSKSARILRTNFGPNADNQGGRGQSFTCNCNPKNIKNRFDQKRAAVI